MSLPPPPPNNGGQNPNFRSGSVADGLRTGSVTDRQHDQGFDLQGRASPQPPVGDREDQEKQFKDLLTKYKNVKRLYFDGKKEIELLGGQIEQLQNAVANQRMSQSRTALDDSEYSTRFNRLNGAINNLAFNIRKDWVKLPSWLLPYVSTDALKTGKQEMTAVGRAVITRWMVDEIFNRCFHPGLEPEMSRQLKTIEQNIRHFCYTLNSQEEYEALTTKVVSWRMATLEGLQDVLRSPEAQDHRVEFTRLASSNLTDNLLQHLTDPPPEGVEGSAGMIVELAVGIACNMPLESRDVAVIYPLPEQPIQPEIMEIEKTGLPPLELTRFGADAGVGDDGEDNKEGGKRGAGAEKGRTGSMLNTILGTGSTPGSRKSSVPVDAAGSGGQAAQGSAPSAPQGTSKDAANKVRFAGFVAVEVRGRQVLMKAPVWPLG